MQYQVNSLFVHDLCFACCLADMYFIVKAVEEGEVIIKDSLEQCDNPNHATVTCTAGMSAKLYQCDLRLFSSPW